MRKGNGHFQEYNTVYVGVWVCVQLFKLRRFSKIKGVDFGLWPWFSLGNTKCTIYQSNFIWCNFCYFNSSLVFYNCFENLWYPNLFPENFPLVIFFLYLKPVKIWFKWIIFLFEATNQCRHPSTFSSGNFRCFPAPLCLSLPSSSQ